MSIRFRHLFWGLGLIGLLACSESGSDGDAVTCSEQCTFNPQESEQFNDLRNCLLLGCPNSCI